MYSECIYEHELILYRCSWTQSVAEADPKRARGSCPSRGAPTRQVAAETKNVPIDLPEDRHGLVDVPRVCHGHVVVLLGHHGHVDVPLGCHGHLVVAVGILSGLRPSRSWTCAPFVAKR